MVSARAAVPLIQRSLFGRSQHLSVDTYASVGGGFGSRVNPWVQENGAHSLRQLWPSFRTPLRNFSWPFTSTDATTLPTDLMLARSSDGTRWTEHRISPTFDLATAPVSRGLFLGDYQGLASANNVFVPVYVRTNADVANRTDVFALAARTLTTLPAADTTARPLRAASAAFVPDAQFRQRVHENIVHAMERRVPGWAARFGTPPR